MSDHGLEQIYADDWSDAENVLTFDRARAGKTAEAGAARRYKSALLHRFAVMDHARGWVQQFHLGAMRNNSTRALRALGPDTGYDAIGDLPQAAPLARFLDRLDGTGRLARTVLYNLNPADNEVLATVMGSFQDGS